MASYHPRTLESTLASLSDALPAVLLTGPRQVGKTTMMRQLAARDRRYVTLDDPALRQLAKEDPKLFLDRFPAPLLIDEIQYAPELLPVIKMQIDADRTPGSFWLTGSQQFHAMRDISETLAGRVAILTLLGFSWREAESCGVDTPPFLPTDARVEERGFFSPAFDLDSLAKTVWAGALPETVLDPGMPRDVFLNSYIQTYLQRDVRDLTQVGSLDSFDRFVRACAARTGQLLNLSNLARDVDISVPTAKAWLSILTDTSQVFLLKPFHNSRTKRLVKAPKLYFLDTGLAAHLTGWTSPQTMIQGAASGALIETWVVGEILKSYLHRGVEPPMTYYRDKDGVEIDVLLELDGRVHPIEIKRAATVRTEWMKNFGRLDHLGVERGEGAVLCLVDEPLPIDEHNQALPFAAL